MGLPRLIPVEDFVADPSFSAAQISPDGAKLAYLAPKYGKLQVWVRGIDETHDDAVCVTRDERRGIHTFYWTDDPRWLLYRQDTDGNEDWHIWRVDLENPEAAPVDLTPLPRFGRALGAHQLEQFPGKLFVAMNQRPLDFDSWMIDIATGETTLFRESDGSDGNYFGAEGSADFFAQKATDGTHEFYAVDEDGTKRLIYTADGPANPTVVFPMATTPTRDDKALLLAAHHESDHSRWIRVDHADGKVTVLADVPGQSVCLLGMFTEDFGLPPSLVSSAKTGEIIGVRFVGDRPAIKVLDPSYDDVFTAVSQLSDGEIFSLQSDDSEATWVVSFIHDTEPGATYLYDRGTGESRCLYSPREELDPSDLAPMQSVHFEARDGLPLHAFLTVPVGVEPKDLPLVLMVHGGPWAHDIWGYNRDVQFLANRGYAVLQVNFRGSTGYGRHHITAAIGQLAGTMHDDLIDACDWAVKQGIADPARIGIYGGSYGGYSALVGVTFTPDYFAAAVDYVGVSSLVNFMELLPPFIRGTALQNSWMLYAGDPDDPDQRADMLARSPVTHLDKVKTPLLVVQGAQDARVPQVESDLVVETLRARGVEVEYFVAEDEGHDFKNPENLVTMFKLIEKHFAEHLGGRSA